MWRWRFDDDQSHLFASGGARNDTYGTGDFYYREFHVEYAFTKHLTGPWSLELQGRHRHRREDTQNFDRFDTSFRAHKASF